MRVFAEGSLVRERCAIQECERPIFRGEWCGAHYKRHQRKKVVVGLIAERLGSEEKVIETGSDWLEASAEDDDGARRKRAAFLRATAAWLTALGWTPPRRGRVRV